MEYRRLEIGRRIKELRRQKKFSQSFIAEKLFISQAAYSLIENSQNGIIAEHIIKLSRIYDVTTDFILTGEKALVKLSQANGFIPYIKVHAHAGFIKNLNKEIATEDYEWYRIPGFNPTLDEKLFEIEGNSMVPTVLPGDVVICQTQPKIDNVLDGSLVLLITKDSILLKRLHLDKNPNMLLLENDNPGEEEEQRMCKAEIREVMMVRGKISSSLVPYHQLTSKGKIQTLEESIERLKKELYSLHKKFNSLSRK